MTAHLYQSTLFCLAAWLVTLALRKYPAQLRYSVWFAASIKFLVPFSLLVSLGAHLPYPAAAPPVPYQLAAALQPFDQPAVLHLPTSPNPSHLPVAPVLWACGFLTVATIWLLRWKQVHLLRSSARPLHLPTVVVPVMEAPGLIEPGIFGILRPVLLLPEGLAAQLTATQLDAILAHEFCHVRRRDNLTAAIHMLVQAVFWFHPLTWLIGARLVDEREQACDEEVLRSGHKPNLYAESILAVCRLYLASPLPCVSGVTGSNLKRRIRHIMTNRTVMRLGPGRKLLLAAAALVVVLVPLFTGLLAQPWATTILTTPTGPKFEVASIKPAPPTPPTDHYGIKLNDARVDIGYWSIDQLILRAYGLPAYQLSAPGWAFNTRFDVAAKLPEGATQDQLPQMLQWLLADRFGLVAHSETRDLPGFALTIGRGGAKMKAAPPDPEETASNSRLAHTGRILDALWSDAPQFGLTAFHANGAELHLEFQKLPMEALAQILASYLRAPVLDATGLTGKFQATLDIAMDPTGDATLDTVQRLGLRLEPRKVRLPVLVVDHVAQTPTAN